MVDKNLLEQAIKKSGKKKGYIASQCGLSRSGFLNKCIGKSDFFASEIDVLCKELGIQNLEEKERIFFA